MRTRLTVIAAAVVGMLLLGVAPAGAAPQVQVTASPAELGVGELSTVTATGFSGLETARFEVRSAPGGSIAASGTPSGEYAVDVPIAGGAAQVVFSATQAGSFTVEVLDGETVIGVAPIEVTADAPAEGQAELSADPRTITAGETATISATGLEGLQSARFGLDRTSGGSLTGDDGSATTVTAAVRDGAASVEFTATVAGEFTVSVGDGETVYAQTTVTVTDAEPAPESSASPSPTETAPAAGEGGFPAGLVWIIGAALVVAAGATVLIVLRWPRRSRDAPLSD